MSSDEGESGGIDGLEGDDEELDGDCVVGDVEARSNDSDPNEGLGANPVAHEGSVSGFVQESDGDETGEEDRCTKSACGEHLRQMELTWEGKV